jgi:iron complex outermembrane receptor protein
LLTDNSKTTNIDVQDTLAPRGQHSIIIGLGYTNDGSVINGLQLIGTPKFEKTEVTGSGFVQDQITFSKTLSAQVGSKFENNNFTGWEYEPSAHLGYSPNDQHTLWTSASRAVEIPSLQELGFPLNVGVSPYPVGPNTYIPLSEFFEPAAKNDSQIVAAYEAGYRVQATTSLLIDLSVFYNEYSQLLGVKSFGTPVQSAGPPPGLVVPFALTNIGSGSSSGGEVASHIKLSPEWRVNVGYSYVTAHIAPSQYASLFDTPTSQLEIQSYRDLTKKLEFDSAAYFVAANKQDNSGSYTKLDLRLGYKPTSKIEISVGGNNLLKNEYAQFGSSSPLTTYLVQREFYTKISWKY